MYFLIDKDTFNIDYGAGPNGFCITSLRLYLHLIYNCILSH